jgi:hypothetical protein
VIVGTGGIGFAGRWWAVLVPFAVVPAFYLGLDEGWWGYGLGDSWPYAMLGVLVAAVTATAVAVAIRGVIDRLRRPPG